MNKLKEWLAGNTAELIIRIIVVISLLGFLILGYNISQTNNCLRKEIQEQTQDRQAIDNLVTSISVAKTQADTVKALEAYIKFQSSHPATPGGLC